jgi:hypothetical protein
MDRKRVAYWASVPILGGIMGVVGYKLMAGRFFFVYIAVGFAVGISLLIYGRNAPW